LKAGSRGATATSRKKLEATAPDAEWRESQKLFRKFAERRANGEVFVLPALLPPHERRLHIRRTLLEDNAFRIRNRPEGARAKFEKLTHGEWNFFRGTALLYYRDCAGTDGHLPTVLTIGDIHPENFGVMPNVHGSPFFGINDFDEAGFAPFSWDVKRGAVGFYLCPRSHGQKKKHARAAAEAFVRGYIEGLRSFRDNDEERSHQYRLDNSPPMIHDLIEGAISSRKKFLADLIDLEKGRFRPGEEIVPYSGHIDDFQKAVDRYAKGRGRDASELRRKGHFRVKDVAVKKDSGTASLGLDRYFALIDGKTEDPVDDVLLEIKQSRQSAMNGLVPNVKEREKKAQRIVDSHQVHLAGGDRYYGTTELDGTSFLVRERSPFKTSIDVEDLDADEWPAYADICGHVLAQAHARSDEDTRTLKGSAEDAILDSISERVFIADVLSFAVAAAHRVRNDYRLYCDDYAAGAFDA
jgi:uncharacterized protein (DUF2252 family)